MEYPENLLYTKDHEWIKLDGDTATMGITYFAQSELGDVVFVDLPEVGKEVKQNQTICVVESTKAASDVYAPISGVVTEVNNALRDNPERLNQDPYDSAWMVKISKLNQEEVANLLSAEKYKALLGV